MTKAATDLPKTIPYYLAERIQHDIIRGRYKPGTSLREVELGAEYGSSRGPVRESLRLLELQGLVVHAPRRGFRVSEYTAEDIDRLYRLRAQLEGTVIEALAGTDTTRLADELDRINEDMRGATEKGDIERYFALNIAFHQLIIDWTGSRILIRVLSIINDMSLPIRYLLLSERFPRGNDYDYHRRVLDAIRRRDFMLARQLTEIHILENLPRVLAIYPFGDSTAGQGVEPEPA